MDLPGTMPQPGESRESKSVKDRTGQDGKEKARKDAEESGVASRECKNAGEWRCEVAPTSWEEYEELKKKLRRLQDRLQDRLKELQEAKGQFDAVRRLEGVRYKGRVSGIFGYLEALQVRLLVMDIERDLEAAISRAVREYYVNYTKSSEDGYWLPGEEEEFKPTLYLFLDVSGSIPAMTARLFAKAAIEIARRYRAQVKIIPFEYDVIEEGETEVEGWEDRVRIPKGSGTMLGRLAAKKLTEAAREEVPLVIVLSDFYIGYTPEFYEAMKAYKNSMGKVFCYTVSSVSEWYCDRTRRFADAFRILGR